MASAGIKFAAILPLLAAAGSPQGKYCGFVEYLTDGEDLGLLNITFDDSSQPGTLGFDVSYMHCPNEPYSLDKESRAITLPLNNLSDCVTKGLASGPPEGAVHSFSLTYTDDSDTIKVSLHIDQDHMGLGTLDKSTCGDSAPVVVTGFDSTPPQQNASIYIIRHGEKNWALGCLDKQGQARAENLVNVFDGKPSLKHETFGAPKSIFANWYHDPIDCERCNQTVSPISKALGIPIDLSYGGLPRNAGGGNMGAAAAMKQALHATGGPVLVAWEHMNIQYLTEDLGVPKTLIPKWDNSDYDSVYVLEFGEAQNFESFRISAEHFVPNNHAAADVIV